VVVPVILYVLFALALTYVYAPIRGLMGQAWMAKVFAYAMSARSAPPSTT